MADYSAKIDLVVASQAGERRLAAVANQVARIQSLVNTLNRSPVELFAQGRGPQKDASAVLSKDLRNIIREFENGDRKIGKSVSSLTQQIAAFNEILDQVEFSSGSFKKQDNTVKQLIGTLNKANKALTEQERKKINILRVSQKLQTLEQREFEVARRRTLLASRRVNQERAITRERQRQAELGTQGERDRKFGQRIEGIALGAGFPLLFGGGPGAVLGGALGGVAGGFGAQIILSAVGQIFDKFVAAAVNAGNALRKPIEAFEELIRIGGLAGTAVSRQVRVAEFLGIGEVGATGVSRAARSNIGAENVDALVKFAESTEQLSNTFAIFDTNLKALLARGLTPVTNALDDFLKGLTGLQGKVDFADVSKVRRLESDIATLEQAGAKPAAIAPYRELLKTLQEQNAAAQEYKDLQDQIQEIANRVVSNAEAAARFEADRLSLTRLAAASRQGQLAVNQASLELDKLRVRLTDEVKGAEREILEILIKQAEARKEQAEAAQRNAVEETRRQLERERLQREGQVLGLREQTRNVIVAQAQFERGLLATFDSQEQALRMGYKNKLDALDLERQSALIGVNELNVQKEINELYARRALLLRQQTEFSMRQLEAAAASSAIGEAQFGNQQQQKRLAAGGRAASAIQAADPTAGFVPFFGASEKMQQQQIVDFNTQLDNMNKQLQDTEDIINSIDFEKLSFKEQRGLEKQAEDIRNNIAVFKEYQPAVNEAVLMQQRFQDALQLTQPAVQAVATMFRDFADEAVTGTEAVGRALKSFGEILIQESLKIIAAYVAMGIAKAFFDGGSKAPGVETDAEFMERTGKLGFADGGYPPVGQASIVGERGPELFVPGRQGAIVPNDIFAATRAALNKGGTSSSGAFEENAQALAVSSSYTRERVMERERQTMLTGAGGSMLIQTEVINNVEYATVDQVAQIAATSAKQARAQVFADMRNKPSTRASLGMR